MTTKTPRDVMHLCCFTTFKTKRQAGDAQDPNDAQRANNTNASI